MTYTTPPRSVDEGIPRFVDTDGITQNWSRQWRIWDQLHSSGEMRRKTHEGFVSKFGFDPRDPTITPMKVLDAGCGNGRNAELFAGTQHTVWAADSSLSVRYAARNVKAANVHFLQADINDLPFGDGFFDCVFSDGVLIHVPDIRQTITHLASKVRPGGILALAMAKVWDSSEIQAIRRERVIEFYRKFTVNMPEPILSAIVAFLSSLYCLGRIPFIFYLVPEWHPDAEWRRCYIHDYLTAKYRERQRPERILGILGELGFVDLHTAPSHEIRVRGRRPAAG